MSGAVLHSASSEAGRAHLKSMMSGRNINLNIVSLLPLPKGWKELKTKENKIYYLHEATSKTVWERPTEEIKEEPLKDDSDEYELAVGWEEKFSNSKKKPYFYNPASGETAWERPRGAKKKTPKQIEEEEEESEEEESSDEESTSEEEWSDEESSSEESSDEEEEEEETAIYVPGLLPKKMPSGWEEFKTEEDSYYYFHRATGTVQWEKPTGAPPLPKKRNAAEAVAELVAMAAASRGTKKTTPQSPANGSFLKVSNPIAVAGRPRGASASAESAVLALKLGKVSLTNAVVPGKGGAGVGTKGGATKATLSKVKQKAEEEEEDEEDEDEDDEEDEDVEDVVRAKTPVVVAKTDPKSVKRKKS